MLQQNKLPAQAAGASEPDVQILLDDIRAVGCSVPSLHSNQIICGASVTLPVQDLLQSPAAFDAVARLIRQHVAGDMGLMLRLQDLGDGDASTEALETLCARLSASGVPGSRHIGVCVRASSVPLRAFSLITRCWLGAGPRYTLIGASQMRSDVSQADIVRDWDYLWRFRGSRWEVLPAYGEIVSTPCPLLADETANTVLPPLGIQVPSGSAWIPLQLYLPQFANENGDIQGEALDHALAVCLDSSEQLFNLLCWPLPEMQRDAWLNRRIALVIAGFGDLIQLQKRDPSDFHVLRYLLDLVEHIRTTVWARSTQLARRRELLPAIARHEPSFQAADEHHQRKWAARWQIAIERSAVGHRNLLVMSPYSVLPKAGDECAAFADLLPVISYADAHNFAGPPAFRGWKFRDFRHFHRRAWAVIQRRNRASLIATRA